jgi:transcriptional regulator with XRE-family HTH domain
MNDSMELELKVFKNRLKKLIKDSPHLNQQRVAAKAGISQPYLNEILNGHKTGSFELLHKIAVASGVSFQDWMTQSNPAGRWMIAETEEEARLLGYFRKLSDSKKSLLLRIAFDYYKYCTIIEGNPTPDD